MSGERCTRCRSEMRSVEEVAKDAEQPLGEAPSKLGRAAAEILKRALADRKAGVCGICSLSKNIGLLGEAA